MYVYIYIIIIVIVIIIIIVIRTCLFVCFYDKCRVAWTVQINDLIVLMIRAGLLGRCKYLNLLFLLQMPCYMDGANNWFACCLMMDAELHGRCT